MDVDFVANDNSTRKRVATACEACRATKIRCQPSEQPGVCKKCLESKRECISRTTPRPRRPRKYASSQDQLQQSQAAPPGPSSTFSINFSVPAEPEVDDNFETLREAHDLVIDRLFPDDDEDTSPFPDSIRSFQTPTSCSTQPHSIHDLHTKPSFNVSSAESLLKCFHSMLKYFPFITLQHDTTVMQLAASKPFVLLAILSSASGSRTLHGHSLYDEEFRKVLGLKFVAGGETSMELLQGVLIYCAWYPFHLRPKNKQAFQYIRMASDMIHDMELDQEQSLPSLWSDSPPLTDEQLDGIRAYVGYFYLVATFLVAWKRKNGIDVSFTPWTAKCCDLLERHGQTEGDRVLAAQCRVANIFYQASNTMNYNNGKPDDDRRIMLAGLKSELIQLESRLPYSVSSLASLKIQILFIKMYLDGGTVLKLPRPLPSETLIWNPLSSVNSKLCDAVYSLSVLLKEITSLDDSEFNCFTLLDWSRPILGTILGIRLSFKIAECPEYDPEWARTQLHLDEFLAHMSQQKSDLTPASKQVDVLSASRIVMGVVRDKYQKRLRASENNVEMKPGPPVLHCPMLDGSMDSYFPVWDAGFNPPPELEAMGIVGEGSDGQPIFQDLWTTMTMGWANEGQTYELSNDY